jgi:hypothetical protein
MVVVISDASKAMVLGIDEKLIRLLRAGLAANVFLLIAGCMYVGFYAREIKVQWWTRDVTGDVLYLVGFSSFFISGVLELWIDVGWVRTFDHGRYTTQKRTNIIITLMFLLGNIGDLIAFIFWRQGREGIKEEHITQWVTTHIFLLTAIIVLINNRPKYVPFQNGMDSLANLFFLFEALLACCARYVSTVGDTKQNIAEIHLELSAAVFWLLSAACYIVADMIRFKDPDSIVYS